MDNNSWIEVHVYAINFWERVLHLLHLSCVSNCGTIDHLTNVIMQALVEEGELSHELILDKLVLFRANGVGTFQSPQTGMSTQIHEKWAPFCLGANCALHHINLVVDMLSNYPIGLAWRLCVNHSILIFVILTRDILSFISLQI